ncbi:helix-turn-helix transcriptional regulator [Nocardiopsis sp. CT-R113]|uniref:Helix-turn-helix transcriptional regulator n=1 Tax=Nocardiopsis codii TaxID=3065942 RepID=A0ABU7K686_9ACTN|nr:helix-turn-helix transcriptional regulator [Nocardiopsis sp. CT-R113]MEE2037364.1 helix-turn-helix transcriptional regulator [Nocardiopsis sp. CT-R113]
MQDVNGRKVPDVRFGMALMRQRKRAGKTQGALASHIKCTTGHISHVENGRRALSEASVAEVDAFLDAGGRLIRTYGDLYEPDSVDWLGQLHEHQASAEVIREYHNSVFPGVIQVSSYARAVFSSGSPWLGEEGTKERVAVRLERSKVVLRANGPQYHVVLDDIVLHRPVGPPSTMKEQIDEVIKKAESGRIMLQMHGWGQYPNPGLDGPYSVLMSVGAPDLVYVESIYGGQSTDDPVTVRQFGVLFSRLQANARSPGDSLALLKEWSERYGKAQSA